MNVKTILLQVGEHTIYLTGGERVVEPFVESLVLRWEEDIPAHATDCGHTVVLCMRDV